MLEIILFLERKLRKLPCVILCGGKSSRMGSNKALLEFSHRPLAQYMYEKMQKIFAEIYLVAKDDTPFKEFSHQFIQERSEIYAPLIGIEASLQKLHQAFFISVDTPFVSGEMIEKMLESLGSEEILYAKSKERSHFLCGIYHQSILPKAREMIEKEDFKMSHLISQVRSAYVEFEDESAFDNLNTPNEYQKALKRIECNG